MTMFRNIGSALTMGGAETAKAEEAREKYIERCSRHEEIYGASEEFVAKPQSTEEMRVAVL